MMRELMESAAMFVGTGKTEVLVREVGELLSEDEMNRLTPAQRERFSKMSDPARKREWSESRRCEWILRAFPFRSFSHTRSKTHHYVFAWGVDAPVRGIGIDVELLSRSISPAAAERFVKPQEIAQGLSALEVWTIKEAVYKSNPENSASVLTQYEVTSFDRGKKSGEARGPSGEHYKFSLSQVNGQNCAWIVSLAQSL